MLKLAKVSAAAGLLLLLATMVEEVVGDRRGYQDLDQDARQTLVLQQLE